MDIYAAIRRLTDAGRAAVLVHPSSWNSPRVVDRAIVSRNGVVTARLNELIRSGGSLAAR